MFKLNCYSQKKYINTALSNLLTNLSTLLIICFMCFIVDKSALALDTTKPVTAGQVKLLRKPILLYTFEHFDRVTSASVSPDGKVALTVTEGQTVVLWDIETGKRLHALQHERGVDSGVFLADGKMVLTTSARWINDAYSSFAVLWKVDTGQRLQTYNHGVSLSITALLSPDEKTVLTSAKGISILWNVYTGEKENSYNIGIGEGDLYSPDGKSLLSTYRKSARLFQLESGQKLRAFEHEGKMTSVAFSPNGQLILTASLDGKADLWQLDGGWIKSFEHDEGVYSAIFSPDGKTVLTSCKDGLAYLWPVN